MKHRLALWALAGFLVALSWVAVSLAVPLSAHRALWRLAELTCPIALFGRFAIKWYWAVFSNGAVYLLVGVVVEGLLRLTRLRAASA